MKKISKILAVVLCLSLAVSMLVVGVSAATEKSVEFTVDSLGLENKKYTAGTTTVDGVGVEWIQLGNYGNGIQMRDKEGNTSMFWNTTAFPGGITKIELTFDDVKSTYDNADAVIFNFGNEVKGTAYSTKLSTVQGEKSYTITPDANTYTYFYLEHDLGYTFYWDSIKVYYSESEGGSEIPEAPEQPEQPETTVVDIKTALDAESGTFTVKGIVVAIDSKNVYIQDATGGICVRTNDQPADLTMGYEIIATGEKSVYNGMPQLNGSTYEVPEYEAKELVAKETTIDALTTADLATYIKLCCVTITEIFDNDGQYTLPNVTVSDGTNTIQIYKCVMDKNEDGTWAYAVGDVVDVTASVGCFKDTLQLRNTFASEISEHEDAPAGPENPEQPEDPDIPEEEIPKTADVSVLAAALVAVCATTGLVVLTKKEQF